MIHLVIYTSLYCNSFRRFSLFPRFPRSEAGKQVATALFG